MITSFLFLSNIGEVKLKRPMTELTSISGGKQPALLTVMADEEVTGIGEPPAMSTVTDLVLILDNMINSSPYFHNAKYVVTNNVPLSRRVTG